VIGFLVLWDKRGRWRVSLSLRLNPNLWPSKTIVCFIQLLNYTGQSQLLLVSILFVCLLFQMRPITDNFQMLLTIIFHRLDCQLWQGSPDRCRGWRDVTRRDEKGSLDIEVCSWESRMRSGQLVICHIQSVLLETVTQTSRATIKDNHAAPQTRMMFTTKRSLQLLWGRLDTRSETIVQVPASLCQLRADVGAGATKVR
jgi:hypothetical protein